MSDGVPVVFRAGGRYPAVLTDGGSTSTIPFVDIAIYCTRTYHRDGTVSVTDVKLTVSAVGRYVGGRRRTLNVWRCSCDSQEAAVQLGRHQVVAALAVLATIDQQYDTAEDRIATVESYRGRALSRADYETACQTHDVAELSDAQIDTYGIRYGEFSYPEYAADHVMRMRLARSRLSGLDAAKTKPPANFTPHLTSAGEGFYRPDASETDRRCARCGTKRAAWIAGAGEALCVRHQDDY